MNEQTDRDDAAKHRCYGKRDQVKIGETRFQVEMHPRLHTRIRATRLCGAAHRAVDGVLYGAVAALSPRSCGLLVESTCGVAIALISRRERKRRQPGLATDNPAFVRRHQLVRSIQRSEAHFDFVGGACKDGRSAARAEVSPRVVARLAFDRHCIPREYRRRAEQGAVMLAAVQTVT